MILCESFDSVSPLLISVWLMVGGGLLACLPSLWLPTSYQCRLCWLSADRFCLNTTFSSEWRLLKAEVLLRRNRQQDVSSTLFVDWRLPQPQPQRTAVSDYLLLHRSTVEAPLPNVTWKDEA